MKTLFSKVDAEDLLQITPYLSLAIADVDAGLVTKMDQKELRRLHYTEPTPCELKALNTLAEVCTAELDEIDAAARNEAANTLVAMRASAWTTDLSLKCMEVASGLPAASDDKKEPFLLGKVPPTVSAGSRRYFEADSVARKGDSDDDLAMTGGRRKRTVKDTAQKQAPRIAPKKAVDSGAAEGLPSKRKAVTLAKMYTASPSPEKAAVFTGSSSDSKDTKSSSPAFVAAAASKADEFTAPATAYDNTAGTNEPPHKKQRQSPAVSGPATTTNKTATKRNNRQLKHKVTTTAAASLAPVQQANDKANDRNQASKWFVDGPSFAPPLSTLLNRNWDDLIPTEGKLWLEQKNAGATRQPLGLDMSGDPALIENALAALLPKPEIYPEIKEGCIRKYVWWRKKFPGREFKIAHAQKACRFDVNKISQVHVLLRKLGWYDQRHYEGGRIESIVEGWKAQRRANGEDVRLKVVHPVDKLNGRYEKEVEWVDVEEMYHGIEQGSLPGW